jgi:branched-chain amino acid transport system permease protein
MSSRIDIEQGSGTMSRGISVAGGGVAQWITWGGLALALLVLPHVFSQGFSLSLLQQAGIMVIFALSYNMLLGQAGMLSFGHALYFGLGAYFTLHAINAASAGLFFIPLSLMPLVGGLAGAFFGLVFGYVSTRRAGTTFAMISLGLGELVHAAALMFSFFGGEGGISGDRVYGEPFFGITFGPGIQVYYLIAAWCFVCMLAMYAFTLTPLGRLANAVRDNPERVEFIGFNPRKVRWMVLIASGFFAGIAGGLMAIHQEIVTADSTNMWRSGSVLLATYIGGTAFFYGPVLGAVVFTLFSVALAKATAAWPLYLGIFFIAIVILSPGGIAGAVAAHAPVLKSRHRSALLARYLLLLVPLALLIFGLVLLVEMTYRLSGHTVSAQSLSLLGLDFVADELGSWAKALGIILLGGVLLRPLLRGAKAVWEDIHQERAEAKGGQP